MSKLDFLFPKFAFRALLKAVRLIKYDLVTWRHLYSNTCDIRHVKSNVTLAVISITIYVSGIETRKYNGRHMKRATK